MVPKLKAWFWARPNSVRSPVNKSGLAIPKTGPSGRKRSRIVVVSSTYPPVVGGAEMDVQRVASALIRRGYQVEVLCQGGPQMPKLNYWIDSAGVPVRILTSESQTRSGHIQFALRVASFLFLRRRTYDIVYFSMQGLHLAAGLPVARILKKPITMKVHGSTVIPLMARSRIGRLELRWLRAWAYAVMLLNDEMRQEALDHGLLESQLLFMPNPVDVDVFAPVAPEEKAISRERLQLPADDFVIIYTGRLSSEKGLLDLLNGFAKAAERPGLHLVLVGDGAQRAELEARVQAVEGLSSRVTFAGRVDSSAVPLWLQASDAFALVSPNEGFSCALSEAMAVGLPAVVSDIPANSQLVQDGVQGFTVDVGDTDAIARCFRQLSEDPETRHEMSIAARDEIVQKYSLDRVVDRYEKLFDVSK